MMDFGSFIRGFFGIGDFHRHRTDEYYIPELGEKDDRNPNYSADPFSGQDFNSPISFFNDIDIMFRNFSSILNHSISEEERGFLPSEVPLSDSNPRDQMLRSPDSDFPISFWPHDEKNKWEPQTDADLDGKVLQGKTEILQDLSPEIRTPISSRHHKSIFISKITKSDGSMEERRSIRDESGSEVTTVRKTIGDQSYEVTTHKDSEGLKEKKENFVNLDEKDLGAFEEKWRFQRDPHFLTPPLSSMQQPSPITKNPPGDLAYSSIFQKLFGF